MNKHLLSITAIAALMVSGYQVQAAPVQGTAKAKMKVYTALAVTPVSDLIFNDAEVGAAAETIDAGNAENANNASFTITGEANKAVTVTLPNDGLVKMMTGGGGSPDTEIAVDAFTSNGVTAIGGAGTSDLFVGATRAALSMTQAAGDYEADFIVDVAY